MWKRPFNQHIQSTESVVRTIPTVSIYHISEPIMSENSPKILSFRLFGEVFHSALRKHCATVRHTERFWRLSHSVPCNFFIYFSPFLSVLFSFILIKVIFGAFLLKQVFYSGLNHTPISYISQTKQKKKVKWTFCHAPTSERRMRHPRIVMIDWQLPNFPRATSF